MIDLEKKILAGLIWDEPYARVVFPFLKPVFFQVSEIRVLATIAGDLFSKYNHRPTIDALRIELEDKTGIDADTLKRGLDLLHELQSSTKFDDAERAWMLQKTEKYFQRRAVSDAILRSIRIIDGGDKSNLSEDAIPGILQEALSLSFDTSIGHDYLHDAERRYEHYQRKEYGVPFSISLLNKVTGGVGMRPKSLTCVAAATGGGKSIFLCDTAAHTVRNGKNVLYITLEMSEESIAERIDVNLMGVNSNSLRSWSKPEFMDRVESLQRKGFGTLIIKEYPTGSAHVGHFRALIEELRQKRNFVPDLICVDYMNICASARIRGNIAANSYTVVKAIAEELRGLAVEYNVPVLTATQLNRGGISNSDVSMTDTSESMGSVHTFDFYFAIIRTEELDEMGQVLFKQLKNRYSDPNYYRRFVVGLDSERMRFYDLEENAQKNLLKHTSVAAAEKTARIEDESYDDSIPVFDRGRSKFEKFSFV